YLFSCKDEPSWGVKNHVNRLLIGRKPNSSQHRFGILNTDIIRYRQPEEAHRILSMYHGDDTGFPLFLKAFQEAGARSVQPMLCTRLLNNKNDDEAPEKYFHSADNAPPPASRSIGHGFLPPRPRQFAGISARY